MPITSAIGASSYSATLSAKGFSGSELMQFTDATAKGTESHLVGKPFSTIDTGLIPGIGVGTGVGLMGILSTSISALAFVVATQSFGQSGENLMDLTDGFGDMVVSMMSGVTLSSNHSIVFQGTGLITPGSIPVVGTSWGDEIRDASSFSGESWGDLAGALGEGGAIGVMSATGQVTISGAFTGPVPPGPVAGLGVGMGSLS